MDSLMMASPIQIGKKVAPNRIIIQPMECNDADALGNPTDLTRQRYRRLAEGAAGVIVFESLTITLESRARKSQLAITEQNARSFERLLREMREINDKPLILFQLNHSGRLSEKTFSKVVAVHPTGEPGVHILTEEEIEKISSSFVEATVIAKQVGADGIDFKHCHGYVGAEIVRPANTRADRFGGNFENRLRFAKETMQKMQKALVDDSFLLGVRISMYDGIRGGFGTAGPEEVIEDLTEPLAFARMLEGLGNHYINVSAGIAGSEITQPSKKYPEGVYRHFGWARAVKQAVEIPVIGSGYSYLRDGKNRLQEADSSKKSLAYWAEKNLRDGNVDLVGIGRQSLADPLFAGKILSGDTNSIDYCTTCDRCLTLMLEQKEVGCAVYNPYYRDLYGQIKSKRGS